ncbi:MAG TPA: putative ABC transporter permease [Lachnospiraceae bacterium]|nr:putative ABC transporter permease [Lachnospiraceae bacterium]
MWDNRILGFEIYYIFSTFLLYSILGWIYESCFVSIRTRTLTNRGFLNGPIIPIYGAGAMLVCVILNPLSNNIPLIFLGGMLLATLLEFVTSYIMEKLFHAKWWDYSQHKFNIQGRICLMVSLFWGFLSVIMITVLRPVSDFIINEFPRKYGEYINDIAIIIIVIDMTITSVSTLKLNQILYNIQKLRDEFVSYIENSKLNEIKDEFLVKYEKSTFADMMESLKVKLEESVKSKESKKQSDFRVELDDRMKALKDKYTITLKNIQRIQKRLLKAFPNMKSINNEFSLKEIRQKYARKRNKQ